MFKRFPRFVLVACMAFAVAACGHIKIGNGLIYQDSDPQAYAGLTMNKLVFCKNTLGGFEICDATAVDGKEEAKVDIEWKVNQDGVFHLKYSATDTKAFEAFRTIADVRAAFGNIVADTLVGLAVPNIKGITPSGVVDKLPDGEGPD